MTDQTQPDLTTAIPLVPKEKVKPRFQLDTRAVIVYWMMFSTFILIVLCWWKPPAADQQVLSLLLGAYIGTGFVLSMQWWMGSSKGSDDKNSLLAPKG